MVANRLQSMFENCNNQKPECEMKVNFKNQHQSENHIQTEFQRQIQYLISNQNRKIELNFKLKLILKARIRTKTDI